MSHADDSERRRGSIAAFLFMPQFSMCFKGFSHLYPVFMRCLAQVLAEARLISKMHPALSYGGRGIPKTSIVDLFGAAWFTLRVKRSTVEQWSLFTGIMLMISMLLAALGAFVMRIFFGLGNAAQAQLFNNPFDHPANPYGAGVGITDITAGPGAITAPTAPLFDARVTSGNISADYGLMVLDKILRQSMTGPVGTGGIMQNALTGLMLTYNTGMTILAGMVTLWMIMSMVVSTAKEGKLGGGRHNMVWAPIRMVFALGMIFPLGAQGYSSGQYIVMKLAEWGSNFGTQGWVRYINGVVGDQSLLAPFSVKNATGLVAGINKIMVCQIAYNAMLYETTNNLPARQVIRVRQDNTPRNGQITNKYTNDTDGNICGSITYGNPAAGSDKQENFAAASLVSPMDPFTAGNATGPDRATNTNYDAALAAALAAFHQKMQAALSTELYENMDVGPTLGNGRNSGPTIMLGRTLACQIVARALAKAPAALPNVVGNLPAPYDYCGAGFVAPAARPTAAIPQQQLGRIMDRIRCVYDNSAPLVPTSPGCAGPNAKADLMNYITAPGGMIAEMQLRGWAGMGMFYQKIAALNATVQGARELAATVEPGSLWEGPKTGMWNSLKCFGRKWIGRPCTSPEIEDKVAIALGEYDAWWTLASAPGETATTPNATESVEMRNYSLTPSSESGGGARTVSSGVKSSGSADGGGVLNWAIGKIWPRPDNFFIFNAVDVASTNTYPMATLVDAGHNIMYTALTIFAGLTILQILSGAEAAFSGGGIGFAVSAVANILATIAMSMLIAGIAVAFYIPVLPLLRVAFAVMTWMVSVFEAMVMVPIAALTHLGSEGEGLAGGARTAWILWLNVLMRPILVVFGFVGGMLIFNAFAVYFHTSFSQGAANLIAGSINPFTIVLGQVAYSIIYLGVLFSAANTSFKLLDIIPNAMMRWMGGSTDTSMDQNDDGKMMAAATLLKSAQPKFNMENGGAKKGGPSAGATQGGAPAS